MRQSLFALSLGFVGLIFATQHAFAGTPRCGAHAAMVNGLGTSYGEARRGIALAANNGVIELFVSERTGSWTITLTLPGEDTCMIASGEHYEAVSDTLPASGDDA